MAFVNASLIFGTLLVGVPIALHLLMRQKPRHLLFPAIQFIRKREESNRRTLRLRQWLLLLLRCLVVILAALALARPSVTSAAFGDWLTIGGLAALALLVGLLLAVALATARGKFLIGSLATFELLIVTLLLVLLIQASRRGSGGMIGDREAPVAAVIVIDSAPRMQYRHRNRTRLEQARATGQWLVGQLPADSRVAVIDARAITPIFAIDLAAARKMIQRVEPTGAPRPVGRLVEMAIQLARTSALQRKEIYVLTDLTTAAWHVEDPERLRRMLDESKETALYVIDVGVAAPRNVALAPPELSTDVLPENGTLALRTSVACVGPGTRRLVELELEKNDPTLPVIRNGKVILPACEPRGRREVVLPDNGSEAIEFRVPRLGLGVHHGRIRLVGQDALDIDDVRYFTIRVRDPWLVLVVAPKDVNTAAFVEAIAPDELRAAHRAAYECLVIRPEDMANHHLEDFAAVVLLDPSPPSALAWQRLGEYVRGGGNIGLFLGRHAAHAAAFNLPDALSLLPGKLGREYRVTGRDMYVAPHRYDHPILAPFRAVASTVPWNRFPVYRHWSLRDLAADAHIILRFGNGQPALVERPVGQGLVVTMTTPITETAVSGGQRPWNELAGPDDWPRFVLVNQIMRYMTHHGLDRLNYATGARVVLHNDATLDPNRYLLFAPNGETEPLQARGGQVVIPVADLPGTYRLKGERDGPVVRGFSTNLPADASDLDRIDAPRLDELLGKDRYQLASDRAAIVRVQGRQRAGREFYPLLVLALALILVMESLLANRFYRVPESGTTS